MARGRGKKRSSKDDGKNGQGMDMVLYVGGFLLMIAVIYMVVSKCGTDEGYAEKKKKKVLKDCPTRDDIPSNIPEDVRIHFSRGLDTKLNKCSMKCLAWPGYTCPPEFNIQPRRDSNNYSSAWMWIEEPTPQPTVGGRTQ